jgi:hypothetical protein
MLSRDAGSIQAHLSSNRRPFGRELQMLPGHRSRPVGGTSHFEQKNWPCEYVMTVL